MWKELLENVRMCAPRIHCITNYVSMNDCANILLACGASPIMAMDEAETAQITAACDGLTINIGTLSRTVIPAMLSSGRRANELGIPVVLDPVGAGASEFRTSSALLLLQEIRFTAIRGNASELRALAAALRDADEQYAPSAALQDADGQYAPSVALRDADEQYAPSVALQDADELCTHIPARPESDGGDVCAASGQSDLKAGENNACGMARAGHSSGVDVGASDRVTEENLDQWIAFVKDFSKRTKAVVALTGAIDIVADAHSAYIIRSGHPMMSRVTGTGCQLSVLMAAFLAANGFKDSRDNAASGSADDMRADTVAKCAEGMRADAVVKCAEGMRADAAMGCAEGMRADAAMECAEGMRTDAAMEYADDMRDAALSGHSKNLQAVAAAVCAMGLCGKNAQKRLTALDGNATYRNYLIDAVYYLTPDDLELEANCAIRQIDEAAGCK